MFYETFWKNYFLTILKYQVQAQFYENRNWATMAKTRREIIFLNGFEEFLRFNLHILFII